MVKRVVLVVGTPCVGKSVLAVRLAEVLGAVYVDLTGFARERGLVVERDVARGSDVVDEAGLRRELKRLIVQAQSSVVVDGHFASVVVPASLVSDVIVMRRNPFELRELMVKRGFSSAKQKENLEAEVLDVCLVEALRFQKLARVCELDVTGKTVEEELAEVLVILDGKKLCRVGCVDWLGMLEAEGKVEEFLNE